MAGSQGNTSTSSDRMIIDLDFCSEGDAGNEASASTANETDVESQRSPTRKVDSEHQSELLSADGIDLVEDIFHRTERSETVEKIGTNSDCDDEDVSQDESNPFDLQETDNDNSRNDDSDTDSRLVIEEKSEEDCHKVRDMTEDKGEGGEKETVSENLVSSSRHIDKTEEEVGDDKDITSEGGTCSVEHIERTGEEERGEQVAVSQHGKNSSGHGEKRQIEVGDEKCIVSTRETCAPKHCEGPEGEVLSQSETCPSEHSEAMEEDTGDGREAVLRRVTRSPEHSLQYELSETFLDNLNPQDDSQDLTEEEEAVSQMEEEDEKGAGPGSSVPSLVHTETDVDTEDEKEAVSHPVTHSPNLSLQFELSETFLDNLNPQDDSQCDEEQEETDKSDNQRTAEKMEEDGDEQKANVSERQMSVPDYGDQFELSETFLDNLNPQDDSQDLDEMNESESEQVGKGTDRCDVSSPQRRKDSSGDEACHLLEPVTAVDSTSPCTEKISSTGEGFSAHCDQHTSVSSPHIQQDTSLCEASSSSIQTARSAGTAVSPHAQQNSSGNETGSSHDEQLSPVNQSSSCDHQVSVSCEMLCHPVQPNSCEVDDDSSPCAQTKTTKDDDPCISQDQTVDEVLKESDGGKIVTSTTAVQNSPPHAQEDGASCAVEGVAVDKDSSHKVEQSIIPGKASPSPADQDVTARKDSSLDAEECSSEKSSEKGSEGTALHSSVDEEQELPASEEKDQETALKEVDAREEGEYSSSPSSPSEPGDDQDGNTSDVLHLSTDDLEMEEDSDNKKTAKENCRNGKDGSHGEVSVNRDPFQSSPRQHEVSDSTPLVEEVNSSGEVDSRQGQERLNEEKSETREKISSEEDGIDIIETGVDLDDRDDNIVPLDSSLEGTPAEGVTEVIQRDEGEKEDGGEDPKTLQTNEDDSDDDVQIIECPPQEPIDTLIVDDDDDDDIVPSNSVSSKTTVCEPSRTSKKKRTVEQDGHDLRIVIRDERREKDDSDRHHKRHERDRRDERRSDSYRRSESDRKSSDHSSRRRHHRSRSQSRERRRKRSRSRSQSPERSSRRRRHRDRSRDRSAERERSSHRKRRRDRSHERRHRSRSRSRSQKHRREDSWDKENRNDRELAERRSKRSRHNRDEDRRDESPEEQSSAKREDSPVPQPPKKSSLKQSHTWKPCDTFLKDPSDSPSTVHSVAEKSNDESDASVEEVVQCEVLTEKKEELVVVPEKETEVIPMDIPMPGPQDIIFLKPEDIPIPTTETMSLPEPFDIPVPLPPLVPEHAPVPIMLPPPPFFENPPLPPVPEEEPMENPPEPPPLPPRWPEAMPTKGEGLLPTPIRRRAALEEAAAAAVYDPAHPTDEEGERFRFPGMPNSAHPPPEIMGGPPPPEIMGGPPPPEIMGGPPPPEIIGGPPPPPRLPGQMMSDGTFVVPAPGEGGLLGPPPPRVPMQPRFGPPRPMMMNRMVLDRPPFNNGPFPNQPPGPPPPPGFRMEMGGPGGPMPLQNQFGQGPPPPGPPPGPPGPHGPPGPPGPPQGFPGPLNDNFEDGPPRPPVGQFPVSVHSGMPEMASMPPPPGLPPPDLPMMSHPPPLDMTIQDNGIADNKFDKTLASLVAPQNLLTVMNDHKIEVESTSVPPPSSVFKVPPPPLELQAKSPNHFHPSVEAPVDVEQSEDSTEVMDMDMSPMDEDCEPMHSADVPAKEADKKLKPLTAIDLKAISNALLKLTSAAADDLPTSAVELTNKEKYMKKLHLQERVVDEVKQALRPFYSHKKIDKEEYKTILRKAVPKVCHSKSGDINPQKIQQLVEGYVSKFQKQRQYGEQKVKPSKTEVPAEKGKANGERAKPTR